MHGIWNLFEYNTPSSKLGFFRSVYARAKSYLCSNLQIVKVLLGMILPVDFFKELVEFVFSVVRASVTFRLLK